MPPPNPMEMLLEEAAALHRAGALSEAADRYERALREDPANAIALYHLAQICCQWGRFADAVDLLRRAPMAEPQLGMHVLLGRALAELGDVDAALGSFDCAIASDSTHAAAYGNKGDLLARCGRLEEAIESYRQAITLEPEGWANWCNLGAAQAELGAHDDALASYERVTALRPDFVEAHTMRGNLLRILGRNAEALASYDRALALSPRDVAVLTARADTLVALKRSQEALASLDQLLSVNSSDAAALSNRGFLLQSLKRHDEALASIERALAIDPNLTEALVNRGAVLSDLGRHAEAVASYDRALAATPNDVRTHCNRAKALFAINHYDEALASAGRALAIDPVHVESLYTRGLVLGRLQRHDEAIAAFEQVLELAPAHRHVLAQLATNCLAICAWNKADAAASRLYQALGTGSAVAAPHILLQLSAPPDVTFAAARRYVEHEVPTGPHLDLGPSPPPGDKIRIAYLSGDFRVHPVGHLTAELFARHDRSRFEIVGISFGPDDKSELRARIVKSFDQFYDVRTAGDREVAVLLRRLGIDISVDLSGHTELARPGVLRYRPAPVQVNYLGYPGTMGADFIDYIIADPAVLPFDQQPFYSEKIVHLPDCFFVNDATKAISRNVPSRAQMGLPEQGFVYCCFNNNYKIGPRVFDVWMRLIKAIPGSVLWLLAANTSARNNLCREAVARGVEPERLIFAERCSHEAYLVRHRLADLFLDTPGYNAGATANDALWAGLPVLTCIGSTLMGRVAASLLRAVGLPEMVTASLDHYEALALGLARDPALLADIRQRLAQNRLTCPLFDTDRFARHIERAYETMTEHQRLGRPPASFAVARLDP